VTTARLIARSGGFFIYRTGMKTKGRTRNQWLEELRKVKKGEQPSDYLPIISPKTIHHEEVNTDGSVSKYTTVEQKTVRIPLYTEEQTVHFKRMCPSVNLSFFLGYFVGNRRNYIWKTDGHWVTCKTGWLNNAKIRSHILGKEIYGVRAGDFTSHVTIDADLHKGNKAVFVRQLTVLLAHFHGRCRVHYCNSESGVHIIIMFDDPIPIETATNWLRNELETIDTEELKQLALDHNMKPISQMEIKPDRKSGCRLPFAAGRVTYTDQPLVGNDWKTFEKYMSWLRKPTYGPMADALAFIVGHLKEQEQAPAKKKVSAAKKKVTTKDVVLGSLGKQKGVYRTTLVDFWTGKTTPADSLNTAIVLTARMLPHYCSEEKATDYIEELIDDLPDDSFSDRLSSGNRKEVSRVIRNTVSKVYDGNAGQADVEKSDEKLSMTKKAWDRIGFNLMDKTTWSRSSSTLGRYFNFKPEHIKSLGYLADILKTSLENCVELTRQVIRIVHTQRELSVKYFLKVVKSFGVGTRHDGRVNEYINALCRLGWIIRLKNYFIDRARTFIAGDEFYGQVSSSTTTPTHTPESRFSVPLFALEQQLEELLDWPKPVEVAKAENRPPPEPVLAATVELGEENNGENID
jgi:hypothetical protein